MSGNEERARKRAEAVRLVGEHGGIRPAARASGLGYDWLRKWYAAAAEAGEAPSLSHRASVQPWKQPSRGERKAEVVADGRVRAVETAVEALPRGRPRRFLLTSAQNNTRLHGPLWENLMALARHLDAEVLVSRFTYDVSSYGAGSVKPGTEKRREDLWYAPELLPYVCDRRVEIAPELVWCGEMNVLPTAVRPLSGLEVYTGRKSGVIPHVKLAMQSVPSGRREPTKFNYTTGTVTQRNYIQKKAGLKAEFHHCYGALLVEVDADGDWFVRQVNADSEGVLHDLDVRVEGGVATTGNRVEAVTWGDVHHAAVDPDVVRLAWGGPGAMVDELEPRRQFLHDLVDFRARNHHDRGDPHKVFRRHVRGTESVEAELLAVARFLADTVDRTWCETVVVDSNHDNALARWLREADYRADPVNARFFLRAQSRVYDAIATGEDDFHVVEWALRRLGAPPAVRFLREDESFVICPDAHGGVECGMHGHLGPDGRRGSANTFARMGRKAVIGHFHSAGIVDGVYVAGLSGRLDQEYNRGPTSWSHSHVVTYPNGKRTVVTMWNGKWRAG